MSKKLQTFLINIAIIEGRHYIWPNTNSAVIVQIHNQKKYTAVKFNTNCPYYNEFLTTLEEVLDKTVTITVIKPGSIVGKRKILGSTVFDVGTVWYQKDHQLYHKWAILTTPDNSRGGTQGYLKLDVCVLSKGEVPKIPPFLSTDEIEGNLFMPDGTAATRQKINFLFDIYRGKNFVKRNPTQEGGKKFDNLPTTHIGVSFSGVTVKTQVKKNSSEPVWNERLLLPEVFPPLCQRFKIELYHENNRRATRYLNLRTISNDNEDGFLPTFGPSFLHFYSPNNLEGYLGKVLLYLQSTLVGDVAEYEVKTQVVQSVVPPLIEEYSRNFEQVVLYVAIFEVSCIVKKFNDKLISFRLSCGPQDDIGDTSTTPPIKTKIMNRNYSFLPIDESKFCLQLTLTLPDIRKRLFNYNLLTNILRELKQRLQNIEDIFNTYDFNTATSETKTLLQETLDFVSSAAGKYIDIVSNYSLEMEPHLDQQRIKLCLKEMQSIMVLSNDISCLQNEKKIFQKLEKIYTKIEALIDIIEDWPQIYLWMIYGNKRVAYYIIHPRNVIHSIVEEERGVNCGNLQSIYLQTEVNNNVAEFISSACKMDVVVWMGLERHFNNFLSFLAASSFETLTKSLVAKETHCYQAQAYIFQGRFSPGSDKSGLCDPLVRVIIGSQFQETEVLRKTLMPVWDQTLVFPRIVLYGSLEFITANPPSVCFEVYDKDEFCKFELVGKSVFKPIVKTVNDKTVPKLLWHKIYSKFNVSGEILAAVDLQEVSENSIAKQDFATVLGIPPEIKPNLVNHRIEVVFWGVRNLKKVQMSQITKPKIVLECCNVSQTSDVIVNAKKSLNFTNPVQKFEARFPEQMEYAPPLSFKMFDCRNFGINAFAGTHVVSLTRFFQVPLTSQERKFRIFDVPENLQETVPSLESIMVSLKEVQKSTQTTSVKCCDHIIKKLCSKKQEKLLPKSDKKPGKLRVNEIEDTSDFDWWTKFYASLEINLATENLFLSHKYTLKIYSSELENQPEFDGFSDTLESFPMYKGKRTGDEAVDEENTTGVFKGAVRVYRWPLDPTYVTPNGLFLEQGIFQDFPPNDSLRFILRVYCIRGINLPPKDLDGKSDPYIRLTLNQQVISDRENHCKSELNPIFGKCFEMNGVLPLDHTLVIAVIDYDSVSMDDVVGETKIDLENRVYTKHRAHCGLAQDYLTSGYCQWRDQQKPTTILEKLCKRYNISDLQYGPKSVMLAGRHFCPANFTASDNLDFDHQTLALEALKKWSEIPLVGCALVPEHVETRSLFNTQKPGIEQLWVDILPCGDLPAPKQVNITPRKPITYELRVIVWNAESVVLDETDLISGDKKSDIFVKGWVTTQEDSQFTDVHYRSLTGQANFNWRFIFTFDYLRSENKIVVKKKKFGSKIQEEKVPCKLTLQIWDNDTFTSHDFLGIVNFDLSKFPRGAYSAKTCSLLQQNSGNFLNLFKIRRTKGWWPAKNYDFQTQSEVFAGALELEFELLTKEEAVKSPAGFGRDDPQGLSKPSRPESAFSWVETPWKAFKYTLKFYKKRACKVAVFLILIIVVIVICYTATQFGLKELLKE